MLRTRIDTLTKTIIWHMTAAGPVTVDIDLTEASSKAKAAVDFADRGWLESSRDLLHGLRVRETPLDDQALI